MHWFDLGVLIVGVLLVVRASIRGSVREVFGLGSLLFALLGALFLSPLLSTAISNRSTFQNTPMMSFIIVFVVAYLLLRLVGNVLREWLHSNESLVQIDHVLGFLIGLCEAVLFGYVLLAGLFIQPYVILDDVLEQSITYAILGPFLPWLFRLWNV